MSYYFTDPTNMIEYEISLTSLSNYPSLRIQDLDKDLKQYSNPEEKNILVQKVQKNI